MQLKPCARTLVIALSLAFAAGCARSGGTQDGSMEGTRGTTDRGDMTGAAGSGQVSRTGLGAGTGEQAGDRIPQTRTIYFEYDSDTIRSEFEPVLNAHARYLRNNPSQRVALQGHTDERGTREYNLALSERRADAVRRFLNVQGVSPSQVEIVAYGEERPAARGQNEEAYAQNRRVVFSY